MIKMTTFLAWLAIFLAVITIGVLLYLQHPKFGSLPTGAHKTKIQQSPNYQHGEFQNLIPTPLFAEGQSFLKVMSQNMRSLGAELGPSSVIKSNIEDLHTLNADEDYFIWLGHSTFYIHLNGNKILIDPVFGPNAAPVPGIIPAFVGTTPFGPEDFAGIDYLLITHDHWDHLDYETLKALAPKVRKVITPLGVSSYLSDWGFSADKIYEGDWFDSFSFDDKLEIHLVPARHYSGRSLKSRQTLWAGFVIKAPELTLLISGDTGYGPHFAELGKRFGTFDLATLDQGQYDSRWPYIHMNPEEALKAAKELNALNVLPSHVGKYTLAKHHWAEPFDRAEQLYRDSFIKLHTPKIGDAIPLKSLADQVYQAWWRQH
jgi:L-ascorbate metabolism protein UlaG (beta-lactamase superfamily)